MIKILINNEEVVCNNNISIKEEMLSTSSTILKNCYPKTWELDKDYTSRYYFPKDYSKCKITDDVYHPEVIGTRVSGTNFTINYNNTLDWKLEEFKGNTLQDGTPTPDTPVEIQSVTGLQNINVCGKNLLPNLVNTQTLNGMTITKNEDGSLTFNGTANAGTNLNINYASDSYIHLESGKKYTASLTNNNGIYFRLAKVSGGNVATFDTPNKQVTFTSNYTGNCFAYLTILNGTTFDNLTIYPQLEKGSATSYEPYKGNTYEVNLGKNLFNSSVITNSKITISEDGTLNVSDVGGANGYCETGKTLSQLCPNLKVGDIVYLYIDTDFYYKGSKRDLIYCRGNWTNGTSKTITQTMLDGIVVIYGGYQTTSHIKIMITKGLDTNYSPYFTPIELNKIGDYQDRIYKDNGKWYIEKNIGKVVLDGTENINQNSATFNNVIRYSLYKPHKYNFKNIINTTDGYSNQLPTINDFSLDQEHFYIYNYNLYMFYNKNRIADVTALKTFLSSNNLIVCAILETPTYTEITNTELISQLESIYNMSLLNGINNINITSENLPMIMQLYYNYKEAYTSEDLLFCGCVKNTGKISLNPREPHFVDLQVLDFKTLLSEGETLNYVITGKTIVEAINQVVNSISDYGFVVGNIEILNPNDIINAYSTLNKTAYDVFQYIADITQSRWTTRMIDENTIAIDFYDPTLMPTANPIQSTQAYYENNQIVDISFNYSTNDYRNKQIMTSDEVYANITQTETIIADGYTQNFMCQNKLGIIETITVNGVSKTFATKSEQELGITADFYYQPGEMQFVSSNTIGTGIVIIITYYPIVKGREIILNTGESTRIETQIGRKGTLSRYENRNDTTSSQELQKIGQSYIKYKGQAEINLKVKTRIDLFNVGQIVEYQAPLEELSTEYMVKSKEVDWYAASDETFYIYELTSNFNYENAVNYFDNQRAKNQGNIGEGETITRNIDLTNDALILFYDTDVEEIQVLNPTSLDFALDGVLI